MPPRKRAAPAQDDNLEAMKPVAKRRSSRQAAFTAAVEQAASRSVKASAMRAIKSRRGPGADDEEQVTEPTTSKKAKLKETKPKKTTKPTGKDVKKGTNTAKEEEEDDEPTDNKKTRDAVSPDPDTADIPIQNPDVARHEGKWYWLLKAEPETRLESGVDVRFSIDDLRARTKPEGWDGIRAYAARNNLRAMNAGDMAFFYHSNCKTPGIVGTMEIVREHSEDKSARRPGTPYYDPQSTRENPRWSLVHVEFRRKFAVPIYLPELREMGKAPGSPLEGMQLLKQSRLSVSKVSKGEWDALCALADEKAKEAGLEHEE